MVEKSTLIKAIWRIKYGFVVYLHHIVIFRHLKHVSSAIIKQTIQNKLIYFRIMLKQNIFIDVFLNTFFITKPYEQV